MYRFNLEEFVDFGDERIAEFTTTKDPYRKQYCIIRTGSTDIANALEYTLHRMLEEGATNEDITLVLGAVRDDSVECSDSDTYIDLGYFIPGHIMTFHVLDDVSGYQKYCMRWYADHDYPLEFLMEEIDMDDSTGIYARIGHLIQARTGDGPLGFIKFMEEKNRE